MEKDFGYWFLIIVQGAFISSITTLIVLFLYPAYTTLKEFKFSLKMYLQETGRLQLDADFIDYKRNVVLPRRREKEVAAAISALKQYVAKGISDNPDTSKQFRIEIGIAFVRDVLEGVLSVEQTKEEIIKVSRELGFTVRHIMKEEVFYGGIYDVYLESEV